MVDREHQEAGSVRWGIEQGLNDAQQGHYSLTAIDPVTNRDMNGYAQTAYQED